MSANINASFGKNKLYRFLCRMKLSKTVGFLPQKVWFSFKYQYSKRLGLNLCGFTTEYQYMSLLGYDMSCPV